MPYLFLIVVVFASLTAAEEMPPVYTTIPQLVEFNKKINARLPGDGSKIFIDEMGQPYKKSPWRADGTGKVIGEIWRFYLIKVFNGDQEHIGDQYYDVYFDLNDKMVKVVNHNVTK